MTIPCQGCFRDFVVGRPDTITVAASLKPDTDFAWELTDQFGNQYLQPFTSDTQGSGSIDMTDLPPGFVNPAMGELLVRVTTPNRGCESFKMRFEGASYDCLLISFRGGYPVKDNVGCVTYDFILSPEGAEFVLSPIGQDFILLDIK